MTFAPDAASLRRFDLNVLLVDDDRILLADVTRMLENRVRELHVAANGREGLLAFSSKKPDLVITDVRMPRMDGILMSEAIRDMRPDVPIVFVTGYDNTDTFKKAIEIGISSYISKPVDENALLGLLQDNEERLHDRRMLEKHKRMGEVMLESLPNPAMLIERESQTVVSANASARELVDTGQVCRGPLFPPSVFTEDVPDSPFVLHAPGTDPMRLGPVRHKGRDWDISVLPLPAGLLLYTANDITRRVRMENRLRASESRYRTLFEESPIALVEIDGSAFRRFLDDQGIPLDELEARLPALFTEPADCTSLARVLEANQAACRLFGARDSAELARRFHELFRADNLEYLQRLALALARGEREYVHEDVFTTLDGAALTLIHHVQVPRDHAHTLDRILFSILDVTESRHNQRLLAHSEQRLKHALDAAQESLWEWDLTTGQIHFGPSWALMLGFDPGAAPTRMSFWRSRLHPSDRHRVLLSLHDHLKGRTEHFVSEHRLRDGKDSWLWTLTRGKVTRRGAGGEPLRMTGTHADISERKKAEELVRIQRDLGQALNTAQNVSQALDHCLSAAMDVDEVDYCGVYLLDQDTDELILSHHQGVSETFRRQAARYGPHDPLTRAVSRGMPDYGMKSFLARYHPRLPLPDQTRTLAAIPLRHEERIIGCLALGSSRERIQVGSGHVLEAIAAQTAGVVVRFETQAALAESRDNFHTLFDSIDDFILILDQDGTIIDHNAALTRRLGRTSDELVGASLPDLHPPGMRDQAREVLSGLLDGRADHSDLPLIDAHQGLVPVETKVTRGRWGNQETLFAISRDMTERVRAESVLRDSEARHREVIASLSEGIVFHDLERDWTMLNPSAEEMLGLTPEEILGRAPLDPAWRAVHEDGTEFDIRCLPIRTCLADNRPVSGMVVGVVHGNGSTVWLSTGAKPLVREPGGAPFGVISSFADITALKRAQDEIKKSRQRYKELAIIDDLTRLYNSRQFFKQLTKEIRRTTRYKHHLSLVLMDIDDFKAYNDTWGHLEGDQVLMGLGRVIRDSIRKADTAYRYGGEEFVVLLPETPGSDAMRLAERIREGFAAIKFSPGGHALVSRTVSVGVTEFVPGEPASEFINRADKNMYEAKRRGKNISYLH